MSIREPAIVVTDVVAKKIEERSGLEMAKIMLFPLKEVYQQENGDLSGFLTKLVNALGQPEAFKALDDLEPSGLEKFWGWLDRYVEMQPGFFGFNVNLNAAIGDMITKKG